MNFESSWKPSVYVDRLNAIDGLRDFYGGQSRLLLLDLPFILVFLALIAFVGGYIIFVPLILFAVLGLATLICGKALKNVLDARSSHDDRRYDFIVEALNGIQTVKAKFDTEYKKTLTEERSKVAADLAESRAIHQQAEGPGRQAAGPCADQGHHTGTCSQSDRRGRRARRNHCALGSDEQRTDCRSPDFA